MLFGKAPLHQGGPQSAGAGVLLRSAVSAWPRRCRGYATVPSAAPRGARELTLIHFNDVYNIESRPIEPVGGAARFAAAIKSYAHEQPLILFSGDVFNPSLISAFTKGKQMVPVLNEIGVHCAAVGNHDFDFGQEVLRQHIRDTRFPWLLSNVLDRQTGQPLGGALRSHVLTWQGVRIGLMGLVEREWLLTIPSLEEGEYTYLDFVEEGRQLARELWEEQGVDFVVALTHMRTHNDAVLAARVPGVQLVLGGHDHHFEITCTQPHGTMLIKSGTDFREFCVIRTNVPPVQRPQQRSRTSSSDTDSSSEEDDPGSSLPGNRFSGSMASISGRMASMSSSMAGSMASMTGSMSGGMSSGGAAEWWERMPRPMVRCEHVEITGDMPEDPAVAAVVQEYAELIDTKMDEPLGWTHVDLEARFDRVRCGETNVANMFADILRIALQADAAFFNGGTIRSDQVHAAGQLCMRDFVAMLPFTDELVLLELSGAQLQQALETGVGSWPQLEGRFLQVSGIRFQFDPSKPPGSRVVPGSVWVAGAPLDPERPYRVATKAYLRGGKDGFDCLKSAPILMDGETAPRLATLVQYLLTRIQELNELVEGEYRTTCQLPAAASSSSGGGGSSSANGTQQHANGGGVIAVDASQPAAAAAQQQRQPAVVGAAAGAAAGSAAHPLHSTASSSSTLESEVFLADGAASSLHTAASVSASVDECAVARHLHSRDHHHSALDCLYSWDPVAGRYGIAPRVEGRIVRVGTEAEAEAAAGPATAAGAGQAAGGAE